MQCELAQMLGKTFIPKVSSFSPPVITGVRYPEAGHRLDSRQLGALAVPGQKHSQILGEVERSSHPQQQKRENRTRAPSQGKSCKYSRYNFTHCNTARTLASGVTHSPEMI